MTCLCEVWCPYCGEPLCGDVDNCYHCPEWEPEYHYELYHLEVR